MELQILTRLAPPISPFVATPHPRSVRPFIVRGNFASESAGHRSDLRRCGATSPGASCAGEMDLSLELANEAIDHAKKLDDPGVWMEALFLMGVTLYYRGDFVGAQQQYETALARYEDDPERTRMWALRVGEHAGVTHRCYLALTLWHLGCADQALKINQEMLDTCTLDRASIQPRLCAASHELAISILRHASGELLRSAASRYGSQQIKDFPCFTRRA